MFWHVQVPLRQKLMLLGLFSLTVIVMIVAIIRVTIVNSSHKNADISWLFFWSNIEMATCKSSCRSFDQLRPTIDQSVLPKAVIIACLASFRQLFVDINSPQAHAAHSRSTSRGGLLSYFQFWGRSSTRLYSHKKWPKNSSEHNDSSKPTESQTHIFPLDSILVRHNVAVSSANRSQSEEV